MTCTQVSPVMLFFLSTASSVGTVYTTYRLLQCHCNASGLQMGVTIHIHLVALSAALSNYIWAVPVMPTTLNAFRIDRPAKALHHSLNASQWVIHTKQHY